MEEEASEPNFEHHSPYELSELITNYFTVRSELLRPSRTRSLKKPSRMKFYYLSYDELSQIMKYLDLRALLTCRLVDRKCNISASYALRDNYHEFKNDTESSGQNLILRIPPSKTNFLRRLPNPNKFFKADGEFLPKKTSIHKLQLCNLLHCLAKGPIDEFELNTKILRRFMENKKLQGRSGITLSLNIPHKRIQQFFHNLKQWDIYWFKDINLEEDVYEEDNLVAPLVNCNLSRALFTMLCFFILDSGDIYKVGKHSIGINCKKGHESVNTQMYKYLEKYYIRQYLYSEVIINILEQRNFFNKQDRTKGRERYAIKLSFDKKFHNISWSNILAITFSFMNLKDTLKYRKISKVFNKAVQNNCKVLVNTSRDEELRLDVKRVPKAFREFYKNSI
ncbi:unnamed protein product [Moneuplotes crassus]|uniref:F-box domain-containing protein n=1 Tax=Euplotes crassus TaxID=5936 RepID=A0AAD1US53_EUPCR|nr:unnamed protein product [Moneuplotes crassus]